MTLMNNKKFQDWDVYYKENKVEGMPWYNANLDSNLENYIKLNNISGGKFLDLGTGPGTQAIQLEQLGFDVTGTDISETVLVRDSAFELNERSRCGTLPDRFLVLDRQFGLVQLSKTTPRACK